MLLLNSGQSKRTRCALRLSSGWQKRTRRALWLRSGQQRRTRRALGRSSERPKQRRHTLQLSSGRLPLEQEVRAALAAAQRQHTVAAAALQGCIAELEGQLAAQQTATVTAETARDSAAARAADLEGQLVAQQAAAAAAQASAGAEVAAAAGQSNQLSKAAMLEQQAIVSRSVSPARPVKLAARSNVQCSQTLQHCCLCRSSSFGV